MSLVGIDLGTSGVRAAAFDEHGALLAEHAVRTPLSRSADRVETDAEAVLAAVWEATASIVISPAVLKDPVTAVSFSVQGEAVVPVDAQERALAPAPVSMDRRGTHAASVIDGLLGHAAFQTITGQPLHPMFSIFKIAAGGDGWTDAAGYRTLDAFVAARLGALPATDYSMAARTGAFDVGRLDWSDRTLSAAGEAAGIEIPASALPRVAAPGTVIGAVDADAAARTGLAKGTPIVAGVHDQAASFLGAGGAAGGPSVFALGSSDCLTVLTAHRPAGLDGTGFACYPIAEGAWITLAGTAAGGWSLEWFADLVREPISDLFTQFDDAPSPLLILPYLAGSGTLDNDPGARGVIAGLALDTTRPQLARAFLESTGYELAKITAAFADRGIKVGDIRTVGTGGSNERALRVRANAAGRSLRPVPGQSSARGAALLAGLGTGTFTGLDALPDALLGEPAVPDREHADWYRRQRERFVDLYITTTPTIHTLVNDEEKT
ncbi:FGGY-family carbohydrate kinase [Microbacterium sp. KR10-403]|uniref:FGGY-family carbohydrate kinase n=1 Tax=Microbacterium sp. KR10-403 TaxID=3158581 RepID=UPI0032E4582B